MKPKKKDPAGKPALDLIEEAVHLLRRAPWSVHLCYYTGSIPFVLGLLYFWSDMSRGAFAYDRVAGSALELAFLFVWMKCWQSVSAAKLTAFLSASDEPRWTMARLLRLVVTQAAVQPTALIARPVALLITLPYGWVRAFYENAVIVGDGREGGLREINGNAGRLARLWPRQNILLLVYLLLFGFVTWLNVIAVALLAPYLLRMFTGIETASTQIPFYFMLFNTTFQATCAACTYLLVNPLTKAAYVLRCFYGASLHSGDDLKLEMRRAVAAAAIALLLLMCPQAARADSPQPAPASNRVKTGELDESITRVLNRDEFAWRLPRQAPPPSSQNFFTRFLDDVQHTIHGWMRSLGRWFWKWIESWFKGRHPSESDGSGPSLDNLRTLLHVVLWGICAVVILLLARLAWTNKKSFRKRTQLKAQAVAAVPDLNSEDTVATQLPEDEWLKLAREMIAKGELRLAIRALYLATLAHLGLRELISIARYKSNRDYQLELRRRARGQGDLLSAFGESVSIFEGVWYGSHETTGEILNRFSANIERIKIA